MAETPSSTSAPAVDKSAPRSDVANSTQRPKAIPLYQLYSRPVPLRTFPLPSFYPNNPLSLFHVAFAWMSQTLFPPPAEPSVVHVGVWSPETRSVHVTDAESMLALWREGFWGKGNLSRSEPNWLKREQIRSGLVAGKVSEELTDARRKERMTAKWDRARIEQEAIERTKQEEARLATTIINGLPNGHAEDPAPVGTREFLAPVGPLELLTLHNSIIELTQLKDLTRGSKNAALTNGSLSSGTVTPLGGSLDEATICHQDKVQGSPNAVNGLHNVGKEANGDVINGIGAPGGSTSADFNTAASEVPSTPNPMKRRKSVRFSPKVESTTFDLTDPPNPNHSSTSSLKNGAIASAGGARTETSVSSGLSASKIPNGGSPDHLDLTESPSLTVVNKEHTQLTLEEAFFLVFALGALSVLDPITNQPIPSKDLMKLFRQYSYFPARTNELSSSLQPDDPFLIHYVVYHHFRSLGWVPRPGIKFGVDWLLYHRGVVFEHAAWGIMILPSYSDPWWKEHGRSAPRRSWHWFNGVNRVLSHVMKSLVLVYVDVPPPGAFNEEEGITGMLKRYTVREILVRRWSSNRNR